MTDSGSCVNTIPGLNSRISLTSASRRVLSALSSPSGKESDRTLSTPRYFDAVFCSASLFCTRSFWSVSGSGLPFLPSVTTMCLMLRPLCAKRATVPPAPKSPSSGWADITIPRLLSSRSAVLSLSPSYRPMRLLGIIYVSKSRLIMSQIRAKLNRPYYSLRASLLDYTLQ